MYLLNLEEDITSRDIMINGRKPRFWAKNMVPSGTIKEEMSTGTIPLLYTVCFTRRTNKKPHFWRKINVFTKEINLYDPNTQLSPPNRPGSPVCGDPAALGAVLAGRERPAICAKPNGESTPQTPINER